jgi:hypothetical protein
MKIISLQWMKILFPSTPHTLHPTPYFQGRFNQTNPTRFDKDGWVIYTLTNLAA